jgi:hypothetical protein
MPRVCYIAVQVEEQYARDVARVHGAGADPGEQDYKSFLKVRQLPGLDPVEIVYVIHSYYCSCSFCTRLRANFASSRM